MVTTLVAPVFADRDILITARFYTPPIGKVRSHSQVYRLNPDGSGLTQLTHGNLNCEDAQWSPNGKYIYYEQSYFKSNQQVTWYFVMTADGREIFATRADSGHAFHGWTSDGRGIIDGDGKVLNIFGAVHSKSNLSSKDRIISLDGKYEFLPDQMMPTEYSFVKNLKTGQSSKVNLK